VGCGCSGIQSLGSADGAGPDGLGLYASGGIFNPAVSGRPAFAGPSPVFTPADFGPDAIERARQGGVLVPRWWDMRAQGFPRGRSETGASHLTGFGAVGPDGLGDMGKPALLGSVTGNVALDAAALGAIGWFVAPNEKDRKVWAAAGAAAGLLAGTIGLIGLLGVAFYQRRER